MLKDSGIVLHNQTRVLRQCESCNSYWLLEDRPRVEGTVRVNYGRNGKGLSYFLSLFSPLIINHLFLLVILFSLKSFSMS